jgi:hypothetical protein
MKASWTYRTAQRCTRREVANATAHTHRTRIAIIVILASDARCAHSRTSSRIVTDRTRSAHSRGIAVQVSLTSRAHRAVRRPRTRVLTARTRSTAALTDTALVLSCNTADARRLSNHTLILTDITQRAYAQTTRRVVQLTHSTCSAGH